MQAGFEVGLADCIATSLSMTQMDGLFLLAPSIPGEVKVNDSVARGGAVCVEIGN